MTAAKTKGRMALGRGLSALISSPVVPITQAKATPELRTVGSAAVAKHTEDGVPQNSDATPQTEGVTFLKRSQIIPNPAQPRKVFSPEDLKELSDSIKNLGVLQPVLVRPAKGNNEGKYEIVAGERRWRAAEMAELMQLPVIIKELSDWESLEIALVENVQRANLNPVEEALGYQNLVNQYSLSQQDVADRIGKDRATVANIIRILKLPPEVQNLVSDNSISLGHAKALLSVKDPRAQISLAKKAVEDGLSVRGLEFLVSQSAPLDGSKQAALMGKSVGIAGSKRAITSFPDIVEKIRRRLGTKVLIKHQAKTGKGRIEIEYFSEEELQRLVDLLAE